jgi:hypothetical protein
VLQSTNASAVAHESPNYVVDSSSAGDLSRGLVYFNLHGRSDDSTWMGEDAQRFYDAVTPDALGAAKLKGCVVFAANCYGAAVADRKVAESCGLAAIQSGAKVFIGATCFSFGAGSHSGFDPRFSDQLAQLFFERYSSGMNAGDALVGARIAYVKRNLVGNMLNPRERKTALQFILLGDPTL